jgi:ankyrin repeat protein
MFVDFGFDTVVDLIGGWEAWMHHGLSAPSVPSSVQAWLDAEGFTDAVTPGMHGNTPLMHAAWRGRLDIVDALLALKVPLDAVNGDGNNALWLGCVSNQPDIVRRLVAAGVPIDHANLTGATSLMYAASSSKPESVQVLLELGADASIQTQDDFTAMDMAASLPCLQLLRAAERSVS